MPLLRGAIDVPESGVFIPAMRLNRVDYYRPWKEDRGDVNVVLRQGRWKGIWNDELESLELYDLDLDPLEQTDVNDKQLEIADRLGQQARAWLADCRSYAQLPDAMGEIDADTQEQLRALGYFN